MESSFVVQPAATPRGLLDHRMSPLGVPMHQLAGPGLMEPLYGSLVRLHFRHGFYPLTDGNTDVLPNEGCYHKGCLVALVFACVDVNPVRILIEQPPVRDVISPAPRCLSLAYFQRTMLG